MSGGRRPIERALGGLLLILVLAGCTGAVASPNSSLRPTARPSLTPTPIPSPSTSPTPTPLPHGVFTATGSMGTDRADATATLLQDGRVLIAGGTSEGVPLATAELYDPETGAFTPTGSMSEVRVAPTATLLADRQVLIAGGSGDDSAELYDVAHGTFSRTGPMTTERESHTSTLLSNGLVLIAGGGQGGPVYLKSAELYNPKTGKFTKTGSMMHARENATATLLADGRVLIAGGDEGLPCGECGQSGVGLASAEIYNPTTGQFTPAGSMTYARYNFAATLLRNGRVLVAGGANESADGGMLASAELYDPGTGKWTATGSMAGSRDDCTATPLHDGRVLVAGFGAELYDPTTGKFSPAAPMQASRHQQTATLLPDGRVLMAGGGPNTAELYWP